MTAPESAESLYNHGTALLKEGDAAGARAYLEKAHRVRPDVAEIGLNLRIARGQLAQKIGLTQLDPVTPAWAAWVRPAGTAIAGPLASLALLLGVLSVWRQLKRENFKDWNSWLRSPVSWSAALSASLALLSALGGRWLDQHPFAVSLSPIEIKSGPGGRFVDLGRLSPGAGFRLTGKARKSEDQGEWIQILHRNQEPGWILESPGTFLMIDPYSRVSSAPDREPSHKEVVQSGS